MIKITVCGHVDMHVVRGVCRKCYKTLSNLVTSGKTTWEELEKSGKCIPKTGAQYFYPRKSKGRESL